MKRLLLAALLLAATPAWAMGLLGVTAPRAYFGAGDVVAATAWYGLKAYSTAQLTGSVNAVRIRRASDDAESNIVILSSGELDVATATTFCASTTCFVRTIYDQAVRLACAGASCDLVQATAANQPQFIFNCLGARPCMRSTSATIRLLSANNFTPATGVTNLTSIANRSAGSSACSDIRENGGGTINRLASGSGAVAGVVTLFGASGSIVSTAVGDFHIGVGLINGASSALYANGVVNTGTVAGSTAAGTPISHQGNAATTCDAVGLSFIDNVVLTGAQAQTLTSIARGSWGF